MHAPERRPPGGRDPRAPYAGCVISCVCVSASTRRSSPFGRSAAAAAPSHNSTQNRRYGKPACDAHQPFFFGSGRAGFPATRSPAGTSLVTTEPAPVSAPSPTFTGATSDVFEPIDDVAADDRLVLLLAVEVAGDRPGADVGILADRRIAEIREVADLHAARQARLLDFDEVARRARRRRAVPRRADARTARSRRRRRWRRPITTLSRTVTPSPRRALERRLLGPIDAVAADPGEPRDRRVRIDHRSRRRSRAPAPDTWCPDRRSSRRRACARAQSRAFISLRARASSTRSLMPSTSR